MDEGKYRWTWYLPLTVNLLFVEFWHDGKKKSILFASYMMPHCHWQYNIHAKAHRSNHIFSLKVNILRERLYQKCAMKPNLKSRRVSNMHNRLILQGWYLIGPWYWLSTKLQYLFPYALFFAMHSV